jgi:DinB superfamily
MNTSTTTIDALKKLFGLSYEVLKRNLEGVMHEESLLQPEVGGNCLNWVLGHVLATRNGALQMLHKDPFWSQEEIANYRRGSAPIKDPSRAQDLGKMVADLDRSQDRLMAGLAEITEPELKAKPEGPSPGETVEETLFILHLHESYHAGQTGLLRRMTGRKGAIQ